jgi:phosphate starvation-inducible PhoH-like protein
MKKSIGVSPNIETLFGTRDENVRLLEDGLNITINLRSNAIELEGAPRDVARAEQVFVDYETLQRAGHAFNNGDLNSMLRVLTSDPNSTLRGLAEAGRQRSFGRRTVQPKSANQRRYLETIEKHDMVFGIGPAGTGKTYLAVAMAISALVAKRVNRIILARPAVEAGWDSCRARCRTRSIPTCVRFMTRSMTCSIPRKSIATSRRMSSRLRRLLSCADEP